MRGLAQSRIYAQGTFGMTAERGTDLKGKRLFRPRWITIESLANVKGMSVILHELRRPLPPARRPGPPARCSRPPPQRGVPCGSLRAASRPPARLAWPRRGLALPRLPLTRSRVRNPTRVVIILGF
jgi:hypothetical protein